jgi:hypothetical protein
MRWQLQAHQDVHRRLQQESFNATDEDIVPQSAAMTAERAPPTNHPHIARGCEFGMTLKTK